MSSAGPRALTSMGVHSQAGQLSQPCHQLMHPPFVQQQPWSAAPVWQQYKSTLAMSFADLSVLERCAGAGTASVAMVFLLEERSPRLVGCWDLDNHLEGVYRHVHGKQPYCVLHVGQHQGDIMKTQLGELPLANIVVAGPYCPPLSTMGQSLHMHSPRAGPSSTVHRHCGWHR